MSAVPEPTCTDCGCRPVHPDATLFVSYCRRCAEKGGHGYLFRMTIDCDKVREQLGEAMLAKLETCLAD